MEFEDLAIILGIGFIALLLATIVLGWVLERTVFKLRFCDDCRKQINEKIQNRGNK